MTPYLGSYKKKIDDLEGSGYCKKCLRVLEKYLKVRPSIHVVSRDILDIFVAGEFSRVDRLSRAMTKVAPGHPDLPVIYALKRDLAKRKRKAEGLYEKGSKPRLSIPADQRKSSLNPPQDSRGRSAGTSPRTREQRKYRGFQKGDLFSVAEERGQLYV